MPLERAVPLHLAPVQYLALVPPESSRLCQEQRFRYHDEIHVDFFRVLPVNLVLWICPSVQSETLPRWRARQRLSQLGLVILT